MFHLLMRSINDTPLALQSSQFWHITGGPQRSSSETSEGGTFPYSLGVFSLNWRGFPGSCSKIYLNQLSVNVYICSFSFFFFCISKIQLEFFRKGS